MRRLEKRCSHHGVTDPADPAIDVGLAGLILLRRQHEICADCSRFAEPPEIVDGLATSDRDKGADPRRAHQPPADMICSFHSAAPALQHGTYHRLWHVQQQAHEHAPQTPTAYLANLEAKPAQNAPNAEFDIEQLGLQ
jgi:hypothetical protein